MCVQTLKNKGRVLLPVFALGRAQEMLLILDEYWDSHPEMQQYPIYYGSKIASRSMDVYKKYVNMMNDNIQKIMDERNPFDFKHVETLKSVREYQDHGPCVVMCSPGTMVSLYPRSSSRVSRCVARATDRVELVLFADEWYVSRAV